MEEYSNELPQAPKVSYLTEDHLGSPRIITDDDREVVSRHDYLAFGDEVTQTVGNVAGRTTAQGYGNDDDIRKQYTGYERDKESGLDYAQARYYNSNHGRFTSVDPLTASASIRNPQTFNRYSYVLNSPYKFVDPLGLISQNSAACGQLCSNREGNSDFQGINGIFTGRDMSAWGGLEKKQQTQEPPEQNVNTNQDSQNVEPATVGISKTSGSQDVEVTNNGGNSSVSVDIETSNDDILKGAKIILEVRQTTNEEIKTKITPDGGGVETEKSQNNQNVANIEITVENLGRPITRDFNIKFENGNTADGVGFKVEIKSITSASGERLDLPRVGALEPGQARTPVSISPRSATFTRNVRSASASPPTPTPPPNNNQSPPTP